MPEVSVIVPNYNHDTFLRQRLETIVNQDFQDFELIILDDCSTDDSKSIIEEYRHHPRVSHIKYNSVNSGKPFSQWSKGITLARGRYIWIAESDDYCSLNFLSTGLSAIREADAEIFYSKTLHVNQQGNAFRSLYWWYQDLNPDRWLSAYVDDCKNEINERLKFKNYIANASSVIFKNIPPLINILENVMDWKYCGDWLFWLQLFKNLPRVAYSIETTNYWREHNSTTRSEKHYDRNIEMLKIYKWVIENVERSQSYPLFTYYFINHLYPIARSNYKEHLKLIINGTRYAPFLPILELQYFLSPKSLLK